MIEVLVVRDPDMADEVTVWVDGIDVTLEAAIVQVDPGAGWDYEDWTAAAAGAVAMVASPAAREAIAAAYADPPGKSYIDGYPQEAM